MTTEQVPMQRKIVLWTKRNQEKQEADEDYKVINDPNYCKQWEYNNNAELHSRWRDGATVACTAIQTANNKKC